MIDWLKSFSPEIKAMLLGIVEGTTEFLPVSSTGHLIMFGEILSFAEDTAPAFDISIQMGAMLAIIWFYRTEIKEIFFFNQRQLLLNILIAFLPVAIVGFCFGKIILNVLFSSTPVGLAFIFGGFFILFVERKYEKTTNFVKIKKLEQISRNDAFKVGLVQILSLFPGTSRSGAVIVAGMFFGMSRHTATKFSFFLALPVIFAAGLYSLFLSWSAITVNDLPIFTIGFLSSFLSALIVIRWLINFVQKRSLRVFAWYRIAMGLIILIFW